MTNKSKILPWMENLADALVDKYGINDGLNGREVLLTIAALAPHEPTVIKISELSEICGAATQQILMGIANYRSIDAPSIHFSFEGQKDLPPEFYLMTKTIILRHVREFLEKKSLDNKSQEPSVPVTRILQLQQTAIDSAGLTAENFWKLIDEEIRQAKQVK